MAGEIAAIAVILGGITAAIIVHAMYRVLQKRADSTESKIDDILLIAIGKPLVILILVASVYIALRYFYELPVRYQWILDSQYVNAFYILLATWIFSSFAHNFIRTYGRWISQQTDSDLDDRIIDILEIAAKYVVWFIGILIVLAYLGIEITPLLAGAGVLGLAVALAAQDILSNFFGGAIIMVDKPFKVNDRIKIDDILGDVVQIGPRSTRIRTLDYQLVTIPNSMLTTSKVINYAAPDIKMKVKIPVSVAYGSDVNRVKEILVQIGREAAARSEYVLDDPAPQAYFLEFGESSLNFTLVVWERAFSFSWETQDYINTRINEVFTEEGIEIPFKQVDVHMR